MINFKEIVQELLSRGMSQADIARQVGTSQPTIHRISTGETKVPHGYTAIALVNLLNQKKAA